MKNEVYILLLIYLTVSPYVFANLCLKGSSRLKKKHHLLALQANAINYCGSAKGLQRHAKKKISLHSFLPPNNKILLDYKDSIIFPTDEELYGEKNTQLSEHEKNDVEKKEEKNEKKGKAKKKTSIKHKQQPPFNRNQRGGFNLNINPQNRNNFGPGGNGGFGGPRRPAGPGGFGGPQRPQQGEDALNTDKFMNVPGNIPKNIAGKNFFTLDQKGVNKLLQVITPQRWKKDHSKEKKECFSNLAFYGQGGCGSCFVFSAVSFFSIFRCMGTSQFISFSHQDMVNCAPPTSQNNCQGGLPKNVWAYMAQNGVLEQSCLCYESHDGKPKQCSRNACKNAGQPKLTKPEVKEVYFMRDINMMVYAIHYIGPLMSGISINSQNVKALNNFNQGIQGKVKYDLNKLFGGVAASGQHAGHAVVIVAYRVRTDKQECRSQGLIDPAKRDFKRSCVHFKIMNSWAGDWGKQGYAWLPSEMIDWAEVAFPTQKQFDAFLQIYNQGDIQGNVIKFVQKQHRLPWEE